jgi:ribosomal protein S18 acetylase RimI-like enzyme
MSVKLTIRVCTESDKSSFVRLNLEFMQEVMASNPYWAALSQPSTEEMGRIFSEALTMSEQIQIFIAEINGEVVGYANTWTVYSIWSAGKALTVDDLYVSSRYRKCGVGKNIMEHLTRYAEDHGYKRIQLHAEPDNHNALELYRKLKFKEETMQFFMKLI